MFKGAKYLLLCIVCVAFNACNNPTPSDTAKNFVNALYSGDKKILDYVYIPMGQNLTKRQARAVKEVYAIVMEKALDELLQEDSEIDTIEIVDETIIGNEALVEMKIIHKDGTVEEETFGLINIDKQWKIEFSYPFQW